MKIVGIGVDLVETARLEAALARHGERFLDRLFTAAERAYCDPQQAAARCYAARFAAKEALSKALGTGIGAELGWLDMEVRRDSAGKPSLFLQGLGAQLAARLGVTEIHLSLSHSEHYAVAQVVACGD